MRIIDTHLHLVYRDRLTYPWLVGAPALNRDWSAESYWAEATPLGIEAALHMEVDVAEPDMLAETAFVLGVHPQVIGAIASGRPEHADFAAHLEKLASLGRVRGIRRLLQRRPPELSQQPLFIENIRRLPAYGLSFDVCVKSHELEIGRRLIAACPDVQFVLDHVGNPRVAEKEWGSWATPMAEIAAMPNVVCKVSGILANVSDGWQVDDIRPYVEYVIELFGWDRVVFGSDHPVVTLFANLTSWVEALREVVAGASQDQQEKLFHRNAARIYRLD